MQLINPLNSRDVVYFGDSQGNIYRFDGDGSLDAGTDSILVKRRSALIQVPDGNIFDITGRITYRKQFEQTIILRLIAGGRSVFEREIELTIPGADDEGIAFYGGTNYYNDTTSVYGVGFSGRIHIQDWGIAGHTSVAQIEVEVDATEEFILEEILVNLETAQK
jgi:hypothetical protein